MQQKTQGLMETNARRMVDASQEEATLIWSLLFYLSPLGVYVLTPPSFSLITNPAHSHPTQLSKFKQAIPPCKAMKAKIMTVAPKRAVTAISLNSLIQLLP